MFNYSPGRRSYSQTRAATRRSVRAAGPKSRDNAPQDLLSTRTAANEFNINEVTQVG